MILNELKEKGLICPPNFLIANTQYLTLMGSIAYGCSSDNSDNDIYGFTIPPKEQVFPHLAGKIVGFGQKVNRFEQWQEHHIECPESRKTYDFSIYSIVRYFQLCMENNPNMIDSLFVPRRCILHCTSIGNIIRDNRNLFLHKGAWHKFKGYSYSQMHKMTNKKPIGKRKETVEKFGYDVKFATHVVRLLNEIEQILTEKTLDLERNREQLKAIRRGEWTEEQIKQYFTTKELELEKLYTQSSLQHRPDEESIKALLLRCLEQHYGSLDKIIPTPSKEKELLQQIKALCEQTGM